MLHTLHLLLPIFSLRCASCHFVGSSIQVMASSSSGKRHSDAEWLKHKFTIERMFVEEKKSLAETRQRLETDGFLSRESAALHLNDNHIC